MRKERILSADYWIEKDLTEFERDSYILRILCWYHIFISLMNGDCVQKYDTEIYYWWDMLDSCLIISLLQWIACAVNHLCSEWWFNVCDLTASLKYKFWDFFQNNLIFSCLYHICLHSFQHSNVQC